MTTTPTPDELPDVRPADRAWSPKVLASTAATFAAGVLLAVVLALIDHPDQLGGLPPFLRFAIVAALPALASGLAGYATGDPLRRLGAVALDRAPFTVPSVPAHRDPG